MGTVQIMVGDSVSAFLLQPYSLQRELHRHSGGGKIASGFSRRKKEASSFWLQ